MIRATFTSPAPLRAEQAAQGRTISGTAVPWDQVGRIADGRLVRFAPGALSAAPADLPVVLRDHDPTRPLGRVAYAVDTGAGIDVDARVSATRDGDEALILAADGVLGAWSVGADPTAWHQDGDVLVVTAAEWRELSLLTAGAFVGARVTRVAAEQGDPPPPEPATPDEDDDEDDEDAPAPPEDQPDDDRGDQPRQDTEDTMPTEEQTHPAPVAASATLMPTAPARAPVDLRRVAGILAAANAAGMSADTARAQIQAALTNVLTAPGGAGVTPHAYQTEIRGLIVRNRATIDAISSAPLPATGMQIDYPSWKTRPTTGAQATEKTAITSTAAEIEMKNAAVQTWAGGNDISLQLAQRSSPSFLEAYLRAMAADYARKTNTAVAAALLAAAAVVAPPATFLGSVAALLAALNPTTTPPGQVFIGMSWDVASVMFGVTAQNGPAFWSGAISMAGGEPNMSGAGLNLYADWDLPAKTMLAGSKAGATWYEDPASPADIRVVDVSLLGVDVGVYGFGAVTLDYPQSFAKITFTTLPTVADAEPTSSRSK